MKTLTALLLAWISQAFLLRAEPVYEILSSFAYDYPPRAPLAALAMGPDGAYWGSTNGGGKLTCGTIFKINPVSGFRTTVLEFTGAGIDSNGLRKRGTAPAAALVNDGLGNLWGTTSGGGTEGAGTVYKFNVATGTLTTVIDFTRNGFVNKGESPNSKLVSDGAGNFWGTTSGGGGAGGGTIYKINALTNALTTVTEFNNLGDTSGSNPHGGVTDDGSGFFWGATVGGGANNAGTIFKIAANSGQFTTVLSFTGNGASNKGSFPYAMLLNDGGGNLWGTTVLGGAANMGTIFKVNIASGTLTTVIHFTGDGPSDKGARPYSGLAADASGFLWGTTSDSGANSHGTLFKLNPTTGILETVVEFTGNGPTNKGSLPLSPLVSDGAGSLLGVTGAGGANDLGTVFKLNAASGMLVTLAEFTGSNPAGADPDFLSSAFLEATDGSLWAVKRRFRTDDSGGVYKLNPTNGAITGVAQFPHSGDSINDPIPYSGLTRDGSGFFWGTSHIGGEALRGMVYKVNETTGVLTTVVSFGGHDMTAPNRGGAPVAKLVGDGAGFLWGATSNGGAGNFGTIFKINSATGAHTTVIELTGNSAVNKGATPQTALTSDGAGNLWGTTFAGGEFDTGTIFKLNITTGQLTTVVQFTSSIPNSGGAYPQSGLTGDGLGFLWGTTSAGGALDYGTVFKINIATGVLSTVAELT